MLYGPAVVSRPGENGTPSTGCEFTGTNHPKDGPFVSYNGKNYSEAGIISLAKAAGLLVPDSAQAKFEDVVRRLIEAEATLKDRAEETRKLRADLKEATDDLAKAERERDNLKDELAKTKTGAQLIAAAVEKTLNPKGQKNV